MSIARLVFDDKKFCYQTIKIIEINILAGLITDMAIVLINILIAISAWVKKVHVHVCHILFV